MKTFKKFYMEITSICNLACHFCPPTSRKASFIATEEFIRRLEQIKPHTNYVYLHVKGEPLLHPKIDELLDACADRGFKVNLTTNGTLIRKNRHKLLMKPALRQINFSLHSFDGNAGAGDSDEDKREAYVADILSFVREAVASSPIIVSYRLWNLSPDQADDAKANDVERGVNRRILSMIEREYGLDYKIEEKVVRGGGTKVADRIYVNQDHEFEWPDLNAREDDGKGFCHALRNHAAMLVDGTVVPCCLDGEGVIRLGNIHDAPFSEIIESERANNLYNGFSRREAVEELCRKCGYRKRFG